MFSLKLFGLRRSHMRLNEEFPPLGVKGVALRLVQIYPAEIAMIAIGEACHNLGLNVDDVVNYCPELETYEGD